MKRETRETIKDVAFISGASVGVLAGCAMVAIPVVTGVEYLNDKYRKIEANDTRREPEEDSVCLAREFNAGQTGHAIIETYPHYNRFSNKEYRLFAVVGVLTDEALDKNVTINFCTVEDAITQDSEAGTSIPGFRWDLYPAELAATRPAVSAATFAEILDTNR